MKKNLPNILTILRIILIPMLIYFGYTEHIFIIIGIALFILLSDYLDGLLARKWNVTSELGKKLDIIADKLLAITLLILLIIKNHAFFYVLILETIIAIINLIIYIKEHISLSFLMGKARTWVIFITTLVGLASIVLPIKPNVITFFVHLTFVLQILTCLSFLFFPIFNRYKKTDYFTLYVGFYEIIEPFITNKEFLKRKTFAHHVNESVYEHTLKVSFDCYRIAKFFHLDEKSAAIAGLLHDFYEKPWQYSEEKVPFLKKHAFTHAHNAVLNASKVFGKKITPKIKDIMETHMFPLNLSIPKSKEAWLLTIVDKVDSIDFIMHPIELYYIFSKKKKRK